MLSYRCVINLVKLNKHARKNVDGFIFIGDDVIFSVQEMMSHDLHSIWRTGAGYVYGGPFNRINIDEIYDLTTRKALK